MLRRIKGYYCGEPYYTKREKELLEEKYRYKHCYDMEIKYKNCMWSKKLPVMVMGNWKEVCPLCGGVVEYRNMEWCCKSCMLKMVEKSVSLRELFGKKDE